MRYEQVLAAMSERVPYVPSLINQINYGLVEIVVEINNCMLVEIVVEYRN